MNDIDTILKKMEVRAAATKEHQKMTREVFDYYWGTATRSDDPQYWAALCDKIGDIVSYLQSNSILFPNFDAHIEQWSLCKKVAECAKCKMETGCDNRCHFL